MMQGGVKASMRRLLYSGLWVPVFLRPVIRGTYRAGIVVVETLAFLKKIVWIEPVLRAVCERVGRGLRAERLPYMRGAGRLRLGDHVNLSGRSCFYFMGGMPKAPLIEVGSNVFIGNGCTLCAAERVAVGDNCLLSAGVRIHDNDGHPLDSARRLAGEPIRPEDAAPVVLQDNVWVGASAMITKGVTVGRNAVIGMGAVVTRDVPPDAVVAGNPARVVRETGAGEP